MTVRLPVFPAHQPLIYRIFLNFTVINFIEFLFQLIEPPTNDLIRYFDNNKIEIYLILFFAFRAHYKGIWYIFWYIDNKFTIFLTRYWDRLLISIVTFSVQSPTTLFNGDESPTSNTVFVVSFSNIIISIKLRLEWNRSKRTQKIKTFPPIRHIYLFFFYYCGSLRSVLETLN